MPRSSRRAFLGTLGAAAAVLPQFRTHSIHLGADLKPALDGSKRRERLGNRLGRNALPCRQRSSRRCIQRVVLAGDRQAEFGELHATPPARYAD